MSVIRLPNWSNKPQRFGLQITLEGQCHFSDIFFKNREGWPNNWKWMKCEFVWLLVGNNYFLYLCKQTVRFIPTGSHIEGNLLEAEKINIRNTAYIAV